MNHSIPALTEKEYFIKQLTFIDDNYQDLNSLYLSSTPLKERKKDFLSNYVSEVEKYITLCNQAPAEPLCEKY
ncbi:hypothetical protein M5V91_17280 [Cytobacillus pseudoceanisediminis]|uniref:hypothetical protein n=1 Tax=Cytobacillus pseudoceanisediminis TaxID=3051614 RepID=UPI0021891B35|nr:hypothetical protein [Cytobacillus pseudoceanisediminis]UQX52718.1 hypothetical protein M5V91_17280 [Cytobacillus pseudoceanisediminis]